MCQYPLYRRLNRTGKRIVEHAPLQVIKLCTPEPNMPPYLYNEVSGYSYDSTTLQQHHRSQIHDMHGSLSFGICLGVLLLEYSTVNNGIVTLAVTVLVHAEKRLASCS